MSGYLVVRSGTGRYGVPLADVVEVLDVGDVVLVPGTHPAVRGVSAVHGRLMPRVHLQALVQGGARPQPAAPTIVVARGAGLAVAFEVDEVDLAAEGEVLPLPSEWNGPSAIGVARHQGDLVPLLDVSALVARLNAATLSAS